MAISRKKGGRGGGGEISQQRYNLILLINNSVNNLLKVRNDDDVFKTSRNFNLRSCNIRYCRLNFGDCKFSFSVSCSDMEENKAIKLSSTGKQRNNAFFLGEALQ